MCSGGVLVISALACINRRFLHSLRDVDIACPQEFLVEDKHVCGLSWQGFRSTRYSGGAFEVKLQPEF